MRTKFPKWRRAFFSPTFTGQLRVLVDRFFCASNTTCAPLEITFPRVEGYRVELPDESNPRRLRMRGMSFDQYTGRGWVKGDRRRWQPRSVRQVLSKP